MAESPIKTLTDPSGTAFAPATYATAVKYNGSTVAAALTQLEENLITTASGIVTLSSDSQTMTIRGLSFTPQWVAFSITGDTTASTSNRVYAVYYFDNTTNTIVATNTAALTSDGTKVAFSAGKVVITLPSTLRFPAGTYRYITGGV